jgi:hypothetical protein
MVKLAFALAGAMAAGAAIAAGLSTGNEFSTATPGKTVVGFVEMVWNASLGYAQPASSANPLPVTPGAPSAGTYVGNVGSFDIAVPVTPTIQNASYVSGNAVGALQTVAVFRTVAQPSGILNNVALAWKGTETTPLTFFVFDTNPTGSTCTDKSAFSLAAVDIPKLALPPFTLTAAAPSVGTTTTSVNSSFTPLSIKNQDGTASVNLYVCTVSGGTFTPAIGDLNYKISVAQD